MGSADLGLDLGFDFRGGGGRPCLKACLGFVFFSICDERRCEQREQAGRGYAYPECLGKVVQKPDGIVDSGAGGA